MNNSTRNLKMKKLLIASTALVATAGMASADITITGTANAGIYSGLDSKAASNGTIAAPTGAVLTAATTAEFTASVTTPASVSLAAVVMAPPEATVLPATALTRAVPSLLLRPEYTPAAAWPEIVMSAEAIPAVATNAVVAISSVFFILKFLVELFILRTSAGESSEI